jgi:NAD(P)-dependent dehydrogenase (short-subunit alcohol dehydrogenase family)
MDKIAVVTGANLGIGRATADSLLAQGWQVWGLDLTEPETPPNVPRGGSYHHAVCNIADPKSITNAFDLVRRSTDTIGALVCNAGVTIIGELQEITIEEVDTMYQVDLRGQWLTIREAVPLLQKEASVEDPSRIVVVGSIGGMRPKVGNGFYSAFKQAVHTIANIYSVELAPTGIVVNTVAPGTIDTRMSREAAERAAAQSGSKFRVSGVSPLGRIGKPQDVADAIMFFLGDTAKYINGTVLAVDGGTRAAYTGVSTDAFKN